MNLNLKNKKVLITGSTKGIGLQMAKQFLQEGAQVWINGRTEDSVNTALKGLQNFSSSKEQLQSVVGDVGTAQGIGQITQALPEVDILVNNAGIFRSENFPEISRESWLNMFEVNVLSGAQLTQFYLPKMLKKNWGRVIFISSESALNIPEEMVHYGMSKTAQLSVSRGAAELCRGTNVTVNSVLPGPTGTEGVGQFLEELGMTEKEFFEKARPSSIAQRFAKPEEVANLVLFVASEASSMVNGSALKVDGGTAKFVL